MIIFVHKFEAKSYQRKILKFWKFCSVQILSCDLLTPLWTIGQYQYGVTNNYFSYIWWGILSPPIAVTEYDVPQGVEIKSLNRFVVHVFSGP